jgi:hypothetical protein
MSRALFLPLTQTHTIVRNIRLREGSRQNFTYVYGVVDPDYGVLTLVMVLLTLVVQMRLLSCERRTRGCMHVYR